MSGSTNAVHASDRRSLVVAISKLAGGNLAATGMNLVAGYISARLVGPAVLGLFNSIGLVVGYAPWLMLGVGNGLGRELPYWLGKGDRERALRMTATAQAWSGWVASVCAALLILVALWHVLQSRWDLACGWAVNAVVVWVSLFAIQYLQFTYRSAGDFGRVAKVHATQGGLNLLLTGVVALLGFYGLCLRAFIMALANLGQLWHWRPTRVTSAWSGKEFVALTRVGLPIMLVGQLSAWWSVLNDTLVLTTLGTLGLGLNALVSMGNRALIVLPQAVGSVVYPRMTSEYARTGDLRQTLRVAALPVLVLLPLMSGIVALGWFLLPPVVVKLLPNYAEAIPAAQWSLLAWIPLSLGSFNNVFAAVGRMAPYTLAILGGMLAYLAALYLLFGVRKDLVAFAQAMIIGRITFLLLSFAGIGWLLARDRQKRRSVAGSGGV